MSEFLGVNLDSLTSYSIVLLIPEIIIFIIFKHDGAGWRPANYLYETNKVIKTQEKAELELKNHIKKIKEALSPFSAIEEGFTMRDQEPARDGEDRKKWNQVLFH